MGKPPGAAEPLEGFSIRAVARISSIEPDTLRMWERRYGFPKPARTAGGARVYSLEDVEILRLVARAQKEGFRAGEVVGRTRAELVAMLEAAGIGAHEVLDPPVSGEGLRSEHAYVDGLIASLLRSDVTAIRRDLRKAALALGPKRFVTELAAPLTKRLGELWETAVLDIHHEHLMSKLLSTQLRILLSASEELGADRTVLLAAPAGELHELGLEMAAVYLSFHQIQPRVLGADTPAAQIVDAARSLRVDAVGLTISEAADPARARQEVEQVFRALPPDRLFWLGGRGAAKLDIEGPSVRRVDGWGELDQAIRELRAGGGNPGRVTLRAV